MYYRNLMFRLDFQLSILFRNIGSSKSDKNRKKDAECISLLDTPLHLKNSFVSKKISDPDFCTKGKKTYLSRFGQKYFIITYLRKQL